MARALGAGGPLREVPRGRLSRSRGRLLVPCFRPHVKQSRFREVTDLDLSDNGIGVGAAALADAVAGGTALQRFAQIPTSAWPTQV